MIAHAVGNPLRCHGRFLANSDACGLIGLTHAMSSSHEFAPEFHRDIEADIRQSRDDERKGDNDLDWAADMRSSEG